MILLLCLLVKFNLKRIKGIEPKNSKKFKVIVLSKSGGIDDLICSQQKYNKNIEYFNLNRFLVMQIYMAIFDITNEKNSKMYFLKEPKVLKEKYFNFLIKFLNKFYKKYKFNAFIGFNFNYLAEKDFQLACSQLKIPFLLLYKEGVVTELEKSFFAHVLKKKKEKFNGSKIAVYSEDTKKYLVESKFVSKNKIEVVGCSRLSQSYDYKQIKPNDQILYYAIQNDRGLPNRFIKQYGAKFFKDLKLVNLYNPKFNWKELHYKTLKSLKIFALNNPNVLIVIKIKTGTISDMDQYENLPKNIKLQFYGTGHQLLEKSKVVIGWNTTSIFEGIAANRFILLPYFHSKKIFLKKEVN